MLPPLLRTRTLSNRWRRPLLWVSAIIVGFLILLWFTRPSHPIATPNSLEQPTRQPIALPSTPPEKAQLILELFNPNDASLHQQLTSSAIEQQIEQALTTSFVLRKCELLSYRDYSDVFRALILYTQQTKLAADAASAEAAVRRISESSGTSYALIYSRTQCTDVQLPPLAYQLKNWVQLTLTQ